VEATQKWRDEDEVEEKEGIRSFLAKRGIIKYAKN